MASGLASAHGVFTPASAIRVGGRLNNENNWASSFWAAGAKPLTARATLATVSVTAAARAAGSAGRAPESITGTIAAMIAGAAGSRASSVAFAPEIGPRSRVPRSQ